MSIHWIKLIVAAVLEVFGVIGLAHAYDCWTWTVTVILIIASNYLMIYVARVLPGGAVYTVLVGLGGGGTVIARMLCFGGPFSWGKAFLIAVLLSGLIGWKLVTDNE